MPLLFSDRSARPPSPPSPTGGREKARQAFEADDLVQERSRASEWRIRRMSDASSLLDISDVAKSFGSVVALRDAALNVRAGEVHALMGANGAGKSTLVKILTGVFPPTPARSCSTAKRGPFARRRRRARRASSPSIRTRRWFPI